MKTYLLWSFFAYEMKLENGNFMESTEVSVIDTSYDKALERVKKLVKKPYYFCKSVTEYIDK